MLEKGQSVGRYVIESMLGQGGMGIVYRATDVMLRRPVALKVVTPHDDEAMARFLREARAAAALQHPNIVAVYDVGEDDGRVFLALELIEGKALRDVIADASVSFTTRLRWLVDLAKALAAAHERGFIHRDVKPDNVLIAPDGTAKLLDFGIPKEGDPGPASFRTKTGDLFGTPDYMAPEQWASSNVDARADQFAWGMTAYEVLSRRALPERERPPPLQSVAPDVPDAVAACITKAFAHKADERHSDMNAIALLLEPFVGKETGKAITQEATPPVRPKTTRPRAPKKEEPRRPSRAPVFAIALAATCAIGALAVALHYYGKPSGATAPAPSTTTSSSTTPIASASPSSTPPITIAAPSASVSTTSSATHTAPRASSSGAAPAKSGRVALTVYSSYVACEELQAGVAADTGKLARLVEPKIPAIAACFARRLEQPISESDLGTSITFDLVVSKQSGITDVKSAVPADIAACAKELRGLKVEPLDCRRTIFHLALQHNCKCTTNANDGNTVGAQCTTVQCGP